MHILLVLVAFVLGAPAQPPAALSGTLIDATGRSLPAVPVTLVDTADRRKYDTRSGHDGRFTLQGVAAGEYRIEIDKPGFNPVAGRIVIDAGQQLRRDVVAQLAGIAHMYNLGLTPTASRPTERTLVRKAAPPDPCVGSTAAGCVTPPMRTVEAWPVYPRERAEKRVGGEVTITGRLGTDGFLNGLRAADGSDPAMAAAAIAALQLWEYSVARLNGVPQEIPITVTFRFNAGTD